jgi:hypothetical protein
MVVSDVDVDLNDVAQSDVAQSDADLSEADQSVAELRSMVVSDVDLSEALNEALNDVDPNVILVVVVVPWDIQPFLPKECSYQDQNMIRLD